MIRPIETKTNLPYCGSEKVKVRAGIYGEQMTAPEKEEKIRFYRCMACGAEFDERELK